MVSHKVNRRQARQGELLSKRGSPGGEGALGYRVSQKLASAGFCVSPYRPIAARMI